MMLLYEEYFHLISDSFFPIILGEAIDPSNQQSLEKTLDGFIKKQDALLVAIDNSRFEARFEIGSQVFLKGKVYHKLFELNDHLAVHSGSLKSTMISLVQLQHKSAHLDFFTKLRPLTTETSVTCGKVFETLSRCFLAEQKDLNGLLLSLDYWLIKLDDHLLNFHITQCSAFHDTPSHPEKSQNNNSRVYQLFFFVSGYQEMLMTLKDLVQGMSELLICRLDKKNATLARQRSTVSLQSLLVTSSNKTGGVARGIHSLDHPNRFMQALWDFASSFRLYEFKFALKTAVTITLIAIPAFLDATQDLFYEYKMSWAMSSAIVVMTFSVGGTTAAGLYRVLGTLAGAIISIPVWLMFPEDPVGLFFVCGLIGLFGFYIFFQTTYPKIGRVSGFRACCSKMRKTNIRQIFLLTFSIITLQKYAVLEDPVRDQNYTITELAFRRGFAVLFGVIVGILVSWFVWPFRARTAVRKGISRMYQDMSTLLIQLVGLMTAQDAAQNQKKTTRDFLRAEMALRVAWSEVVTSLKDTDHERRFKADFPKETYAKILTSIESILDRFESIRLSIGKKEFRLQPTQPEINSLVQELIGQVLLYFYVLSGAMQLKTPLPPQLPDISGARERFIQGVQRFQNEQSDSMYLAYVLEEIIDELHRLGSFTKFLFGEILPISLV